MNTDYIVGIISLIVTLMCGLIAKKVKWFNTNLIPIQNLLIGIIASIFYYIITKNFSLAISLSGVAAGGTYDIIHNLNKINISSILGDDL